MKNNPKKQALGRGLSALLNPKEVLNEGAVQPAPKNESNSEVADFKIPLEEIERNPFQPRKNFNNDSLNELAESIKSCGIIQPITVRKIRNGKYQIISGERRYLACSIAGLSEIPARVIKATDNEMRQMALIENIQRDDLNPIEIAETFQELMDECNLTQEELSAAVGKDRSTIANFLRLNKLPEEIKDGLRKNEITTGHARALLAIENKEIQLAVFQKIINSGLSVRETERIVNDLKLGKTLGTPKIIKAALPEEFNTKIENLSKHLGTKVDVKISPKGNGTISIPFGSELQLEKILQLLNV